ncbi:uncharacterized protein LOC124171495 [Ischnura elegans]|uniref:uncharacterized protein LOC124171495 n=1 Tax=Ischnura elegans TaxID=197161 RepID=UPI001ED8AAC2|nr:uncharacterized protein LOC124171495 [Ischnura elegans]
MTMFWRCAVMLSLLAIWGAIGFESSFNGAGPRKAGQLDINIDNLGAYNPLTWATAEVQCVDGDEKVSVTSDDCKESTQACVDCKYILLCQNVSGTYHPLFCNKCSFGHCDPVKSVCVDKAPLQCTPHQECTSKGFFPNPLECETYFRCLEEDNNLKLQVLLCPDSQVYQSTANNYTGGCVKRNAPTDCYTTQCKEANKFVPLNHDPRFYMYCVNTTAPPYVFRCPQGHYDETIPGCI